MTDHDCKKNLTVIRRGELVTGCEVCVGNPSVASGANAKHQREWQKKQYRGDTLQPVPSQARDFVRHNGADKAREWGYSEADIRKYS